MIDVSHLWSSIHGNAELKKRLISDISQNKLSHAYIIEGPRNSGKLTLARTVAAAMADNMANVKKISSGASPDVIEITLPEKRKTIGVDTVRELKLAAYIKPNDLEYKVIILNNAELLTVQAQNALLKLIEEPPRGVYIFLLCENVASLLPTIRSRAPVFRMQIFSPGELSEILLAFSPDAQKLKAKEPEVFEAIMRSSGGAYGEALLKIVDTEMKIGDLNYTVLDILTAICERDRTVLLKKIHSIPPDREGFRETLTLMKLALRDIIAHRSTRGDCEYLFPKSDKIPIYAARFSLDRVLKVNDVVLALEKDMKFNPNVQISKALFFTKVSEI